MTPKLLVVALVLAAGLAGCAAEYRTTYHDDGYYSYRNHDRYAYRDRYHDRYVYRDRYPSYSYNRWDPYGIDSHQTN